MRIAQKTTQHNWEIYFYFIKEKLYKYDWSDSGTGAELGISIFTIVSIIMQIPFSSHEIICSSSVQSFHTFIILNL